MASTTEVLSLSAETRKAPSKAASHYVQISDATDQAGGGEVYLSRNRKALANATGGSKPPVFLTSDIGGTQQSIPFRSIGSGMAGDVITVRMVVDLYADFGRIGDLIRTLIEAHPDATADALSEHSDYLLAIVGGDDGDTGADADTGAAEEETPSLS